MLQPEVASRYLQRLQAIDSATPAAATGRTESRRRRSAVYPNQIEKDKGRIRSSRRRSAVYPNQIEKDKGRIESRRRRSAVYPSQNVKDKGEGERHLRRRKRFMTIDTASNRWKNKEIGYKLDGAAGLPFKIITYNNLIHLLFIYTYLFIIDINIYYIGVHIYIYLLIYYEKPRNNGNSTSKYIYKYFQCTIHNYYYS